MTIPLDLPPGVWKNGTRYQARGRYFETNLVRWHDGALRPIGGWQQRSSEGTPFPSVNETGEHYRDLFAWRSNTKERLLVGGGAISVKWIQEGGSYINITPTPLAPGPDNPTTFNGYGTGLYGYEAYGTPRASEGLSVEPVARWVFDNYGENLIAMPDWPTDPTQATLYEWVPSGVTILEVVTEAPDGITDFVITDQRSAMTIGSDTEARLVQWSDVENIRVWTPAVTNQAGSVVLQGSGTMISIDNVGKQVLILTESDAHVGRYIGPPYVYGFDRVGEDCAPLNKSVVVTTNKFAVWIGQRNFWIYDGQLRELKSDLIDFVSEDANPTYYSKSFGWINGSYTEVWWNYVSFDSPDNEPDSYIAWDWEENHWAHGKLDRTAMIDTPVLPDAMGIDHAGLPFWHELTSVNPDGNYAKTGPLEMGNGDKNLAISYIYPDVETPDTEARTEGTGQVSFYFESRQMPTGTVITSPTYQLTNPTPVRVMGRDIMMTITGEQSNWEFGRNRIAVRPIGTGKR